MTYHNNIIETNSNTNKVLTKYNRRTQMENDTLPILPLAPIERIIRKAGADRVAEEASVELAKAIEEYGLEISREAIIVAKHAKRATVKEEDIRLAFTRLKKTIEQTK